MKFHKIKDTKGKLIGLRPIHEELIIKQNGNTYYLYDRAILSKEPFSDLLPESPLYKQFSDKVFFPKVPATQRFYFLHNVNLVFDFLTKTLITPEQLKEIQDEP